jgi:hypothetical protein
VSRYLVIAHQTATSPELQQCAARILHDDPGAEFAVLVPATPVQHRFTWEDGETIDAARARAAEAKAMLEGLGAHVLRTAIGGRVPLLAIADELREHPGYDELIIGTLPKGVSNWLKLDLVSQAGRRFGLPVIHVTAKAGKLVPEPAAARPQRQRQPISRDPAQIDALVARLGAPDYADRREAREALVAVGTPAANAVARALNSPDAEVRWEAARALVDIRDQGSIPALIDALIDENPGVRWLAAEALAAIGDISVAPILRRLLQHSESPWLREGAHHVFCTLRHGDRRTLLLPVISALERSDAATTALASVDQALRQIEDQALASTARG